MRTPDAHNAIAPVFIGGCGRSGTTLLGSMLGAQSDVICTPESPFKIDAIKRVADVADTAALRRWVLNSRRFKLWDLEPERLRAANVESAGTYAEFIASLVRCYADAAGKRDARLWIDHTPTNIRHAAPLAELFPNAKFIHVVRDGRGVAASILPLDWGPNTIEQAARWWMESVTFGLAAESWGGPARVEMCNAHPAGPSFNPEPKATALCHADRAVAFGSGLNESNSQCAPRIARVVRVRFEDLVTQPDETVRRLCEFLECDFDPAMLAASGFRVPKYTSGQHKLVGAEPQPSRAGAWEHQLSARQIEIFESSAGDVLGLLGYPLQFGLRARKATRAERSLLAMQEFYRGKFRNKLRLHRRRRLA